MCANPGSANGWGRGRRFRFPRTREATKNWPARYGAFMRERPKETGDSEDPEDHRDGGATCRSCSLFREKRDQRDEAQAGHRPREAMHMAILGLTLLSARTRRKLDKSGLRFYPGQRHWFEVWMEVRTDGSDG